KDVEADRALPATTDRLRSPRRPRADDAALRSAARRAGHLRRVRRPPPGRREAPLGHPRRRAGLPHGRVSRRPSAAVIVLRFVFPHPGPPRPRQRWPLHSVPAAIPPQPRYLWRVRLYFLLFFVISRGDNRRPRAGSPANGNARRHNASRSARRKRRVRPRPIVAILPSAASSRSCCRVKPDRQVASAYAR